MNILSFFRLIRFWNLIIMAVTMYFIRTFLMETMLNLRGLWLGMNPMDFSVLVLSVVFIAAGGYIINDYFDVHIDTVNKPDKVIIGNVISEKTAFRFYLGFSIIGVFLGLILAIKIHFAQLGLIHLVTVGLLWFYSTTYKRKFLIGNIVVAFLTAMVPLITGLFEPKRAQLAFSFLIAYAGFAFMVNLIREIIKDMEDIEGDRHQGCQTLPIVAGIKISKVVTIILILSVLYFLGVVEYNQYITNDFLSLKYFLGFISLPLLVLLFALPFLKTSIQFHKASVLTKLIMLTGMASTYIFYISFK